MIEGVIVKQLKQTSDERGKVMHMLREDEPYFERFGEIYFSMVYPGAIKGWHLHKKMALNYAVISGTIKLVLYDSRPHSGTFKEIQEFCIGENNYILVKIPFGIVNGFKGISAQPAIVANCATLPYDPEEIIRIDLLDNDIPYNWEHSNAD